MFLRSKTKKTLNPRPRNGSTLDSGIDVAPGINVAPGTSGKDIERSP